ncbi:hypothetical protein QZH41_015154 [Actinostola sp. cb2023]|nr:hypothetical protein QZH41_015154 [Actinostola sp. cb2023]
MEGGGRKMEGGRRGGGRWEEEREERRRRREEGGRREEEEEGGGGGRRKEEGGRRKEEGGRRKEEGGRRKEEGGRRKEEVVAQYSSYIILYSVYIVFSCATDCLSAVMVVGVVDDNYINNTKDKFLKLPNYSDPSALTGKWETMRDVIAIPIAELKKRAAPFWPYSWSVHGSLLEDRPLKMTEIETDYNEIIKDSDVSDLYLDGNELKSRKKLRNIFINTNVVSLKLKKNLTDLASPVLITLRHKKVDTLESPACVYWDTINSIWSKKGCKVRKTNSTHTICGCNHLTAFAVAMKEKYTEDLSGRETLVTLAIVFGSISLILLVASAVCVFVVGYHFADNMRIALNLDLALILCQLFFFIGLSDSASKGWGEYERSESQKLSDRQLLGGLFFSYFVPLITGIPVAFGAAVAGYAYQHHGSPIRNEFCWMSVYGADVWYFGAPVLILAILNLVVRAVVLKDVMAWKGNPDDVNIARTKMRLITAIILLPVIILTWLLGVLATNYSEDKVYHYFFVIFHALQDDRWFRYRQDVTYGFIHGD